MANRYHYVRWRWGDKINVGKLADELSESYKVVPIADHGWDLELTLMKEARDRFIIKSDTLTVFLSAYRVVMAQKVAAPFTGKDVMLRNRLLELFPKQRQTFLSFYSRTEPEFDVIEEK